MERSFNTLSKEKSPYLRQHAHDPVNWNTWGDDPLTLAKEKNQLIFLSIGYSTCHWCHVMALESFCDSEVAELINTRFVPILVDCEERPDINQLYMKACRSMLDGYGGWPLNMVLTPDQVPVFAGVYIPKNTSSGMPGLIEILNSLDKKWQVIPDSLTTKGEKIVAALLDNVRSTDDNRILTRQPLDMAVENFRAEFDPVNGGFGPDPRFIKPFSLIFLIRQAWRRGDTELSAMVEKTLSAICRGGITDQIGGGVHRYATDVFWQIPHFEKMIYDQAGLILAYTEAFSFTGKQLYADAIHDIADYIFRDMISSEGLFYTGEDSDIENEEGRHFIWTYAEILEELGKEEGELFCLVYEITENGNFRRSDKGPGTNVLYLKKSWEEWGERLHLHPEKLRSHLKKSRRKLLARRRQRSRPEKDYQVIVAWNSLMISSLAKAGQALKEPLYIQTAENASDYIYRNMQSQDRLVHCLQKGGQQLKGFATDYIFFAQSLLDLYDCTFKPIYLKHAIEITRETIRLFWDNACGGLFKATEDSDSLILRLKEFEEREMPSSNSVALEIFTRLWLMTGDRQWYDFSQSTLKIFSSQVNEPPEDFPWLLQGVSRLIERSRKVVIIKDADGDSEFTDMLREVYMPDTVSMVQPDGTYDALSDLIPAISEMHRVNGKTTAYVCDNFACRPPVTSGEEFRRILMR